MLTIGSLRLDTRVLQAALSGYSDLAMRRVARAHGARFCFHEVVVDRLVLVKGRAQRRILDIPPDDHPTGGQIMGTDPLVFGAAADQMVAAGYDLIDINFGCPVNKVMGRCRGGYHLGQPEVAVAIVREVLSAVGGRVPVTVKMRRGLDDSPEAARQFFQILDSAFAAGIDAVTVHGRTVAQKYVGPSRWDFLARVKQHVGDRVVIGSGDLFGAEDVRRMIEQTGVDGVTLARGCIGNPFLFQQALDCLAGQPPCEPDVLAQRAAIELHWATAREVYGERLGLRRLRSHAIQYARLHLQPIAVRDAFIAMRTADDLAAILEQWYSTESLAVTGA
ncbi:MAG: tRNA-dihydrouridine synthase [Planctomycetes bacterium]|nr:tRNA-dihydrouridine synthase [Planctomycetota bacterium]MCB9872356.1 tRNA-dihydrouridine synthase [Planctomycetota bacterium]MCB9888942.1 tRNA-dihydrouridine synthase [Planctomycetota bacterium]